MNRSSTFESNNSNNPVPLYLDYYSNRRYYENLSKDGIIAKQKKDLLKLATEVGTLEKEVSDLKKKLAISDHCERELAKANEKIEALTKEKEQLMKDSREEIKKLENQVEEVKRSKEYDLAKYRKNLSSYHQKIDYINHIEMENKVNKEEIQDLKAKNEQIKKDTEELIRNKEIKNQIKYSQLKKKMVENLQETKNNVTKLNLEYMDVSNKLTLLQNHQLIVQIEYQAQKIEELTSSKEYLTKKIFELERDIEVHKEVEINLADRVKSLQEGNSSLSNPKTSPREKKLINLLEKKTPYKDESTYIFSQEKKIANLEKMLKMKKDECERNKMISQELRNKINLYEKRYSGLFYFFEDCLNNFFADEDLERNKDLYINIDLIKKCDFTIFSSEEKYALFVLMMKYLLPLVSLNLNASCNIGNNLFETNLNLINRKFNMTEKYLHDPELRKAFLGKNNKITNELAKSSTSSMFSNSIPVLRKTRSEIDPRLNDPKYKAVF